VQRGILRLNPLGDEYLVTDKAFNRGIRNFFNPFAQRISLRNVLFSVLIGALLPLFGILKLAPAIAERLGPSPAIGISLSTLVIAACYALAGIILGFRRRGAILRLGDAHHVCARASAWRIDPELVSLQYLGLRDQLSRVPGQAQAAACSAIIET